MKRVISLVLALAMLVCVFTINVSASENESFHVVVYSGEDRATVHWDSVSGAEIYKLSITSDYEEYNISEMTTQTDFVWTPYDIPMDANIMIKVYAYDNNGVMIAQSIDLKVHVMIMFFDYWSVYGDTDLDLEVTVIDATKVIHHEAKLIQLSKASLSAADVNCDGGVSIIDATMIQRFCAGLSADYSDAYRLGSSFWYGGVYFDVINEELNDSFEE